MATDTRHGADDPIPGDPVAAAQGCGYLRAVATLERLAGFELTAEFFERAARQCRRQECRFARLCQAPPARREARRTVTSIAVSGSPGGRRLASGGAAPIAFSRSTAIDILSDSVGNFIERRSLKFDSLTASSPLDDLYRYWQWLRGATACRLADLDVAQLMRARIIGRLHVVDVRNSDPSDFHYELAGYAIPFKLPRGPSALPHAICADTAVLDYNTVRMTGAPRLQRLRARLDGVAHHYTRLILPLLDVRNGVSHLAVAVELEPGCGVRLAPAS